MNPRSWRSENVIGYALIEQKKYADAEQHIRASLDIAPTALANTNLGALMIATHRPADAIEPLQRAIQLDEKSVDARLLLASAYLALNQPAPAVKFAQEAYDIWPENPQAQELLSTAKKAAASRR